MDFQQTQPIFLQIVDWLCDQIIAGDIAAGEQIPSVREIAAKTGVNPNTVQRAVERMLMSGIIQSQRGKGNFLTNNARQQVLNERREKLYNTQLPKLATEIKLLGLPLDDIYQQLEQLIKKQ
ncbi:MAG: GntR family transcriptional regulator [Bacteroidales bacterium]|nr:GntR family transcriptional regulator [Bacteroidales bacterium]